MSRLRKIFEWVLNGLTLLAILVVVAFMIGARFSRANTSNPKTVPRNGTALALSGIDWRANRTTLVMALQVGCHWCEASAGFYRDLLASNTEGKFHPIAVLPQKVSQ